MRRFLPSLLCAALLCFAGLACEGSDGPPPPTIDAHPGPAPQCDYFGTLHDDGEVFPANDGCNSCKCNPNGDTPGQYGCSLIGCNDAGPPDGAL